MLYKKLPILHADPFEADLDGITQIQKRMFDDSEEFCLWRKGEFDNIPLIHDFIQSLIANKEIILLSLSTIFAGITTVIAIIDRIGRLKNEKKVQNKGKMLGIISTKTDKNSIYLDKFREINADVNVISTDKSGHLRYFVTEKEFCLFFRRGDNDFVGFTGRDQNIQDWLINLFLTEREKA